MIEPFISSSQRVRFARLERHAPEHASLTRCTLELVIHVAFVAKHRAVIHAQQLLQLAHIRGVCRRYRYGMCQTGIDVRAHMNFHPKEPLIALLGLMHDGITLLVLILRRGRGMDDRGVHHRAALEQQSPLLKRVVDHVHHLRRQLVMFQQVAEFEGRRLVRQRILHLRIRQGVPLRHKVDAQHGFQRPRRTGNSLKMLKNTLISIGYGIFIFLAHHSAHHKFAWRAD